MKYVSVMLLVMMFSFSAFAQGSLPLEYASGEYTGGPVYTPWDNDPNHHLHPVSYTKLRPERRLDWRTILAEDMAEERQISFWVGTDFNRNAEDFLDRVDFGVEYKCYAFPKIFNSLSRVFFGNKAKTR